MMSDWMLDDSKLRPLRALAIFFFLPLIVLAYGIMPEAGFVLYFFCGGFAAMGLLEGWILARWFGLSELFCTKWMILANGASLILGQGVIPSIILEMIDLIDPWNVYTFQKQYSVYLLAAWIATLVVEWPFTAACLWRLPRWLPKSLIATAVIQTLTCIPLLGLLVIPGMISPLSGHHIVAPEEIPWPPGMMVYYFDGDRQTIQAFDTDTGETNAIHTMRRRHRTDMSAVFFGGEPIAPDSEIRPLVAGDFDYRPPSAEFPEELGILVDTTGVDRFGSKGGAVDPEETRTSFPFGAQQAPYYWNPLSVAPPHPDFKHLQQVDFDFPERDFEYKFGAETHRLYIRMPSGEGGFRHPILLGDSLVLFQLSDDQICLLDMRTQRIAQKLRGFGPIAVPKDAIVVDGVDDVDLVEEERGGL
jgi:hypothetical protein